MGRGCGPEEQKQKKKKKKDAKVRSRIVDKEMGKRNMVIKGKTGVNSDFSALIDNL